MYYVSWVTIRLGIHPDPPLLGLVRTRVVAEIWTFQVFKVEFKSFKNMSPISACFINADLIISDQTTETINFVY